MFTNTRSGRAAANRKGKGVVASADAAGDGGDEDEVWRRFREAGLLDEDALQQKDREALVQRIAELENELHDYQHNMGLLLIEKEDWAHKFEEINQGLAETQEILRREQAAHLIAITEFVTREENLRKALVLEKQRVANLNEALGEIRSEMAEIRSASDKKMAEAKCLEASLAQKHVEIEGKLHSADAKLAEGSRKSSEADRKFQDAQLLEQKLQKERLSYEAQCKTDEKHCAEQEDHLREWEVKLRASQNRLVEGQRLLNEREEKANAKDKILKEKQTELDETRNMLEALDKSLKVKEGDISIRLQALLEKEKEVASKIADLEEKEKVLVAGEEKLNAREMFVDKSMHDLKDKEDDLDAKSKALKHWEQSVKLDEKKLMEKQQQVGTDIQKQEMLNSDLEKLNATIESRKQQISKEEERLKLSKEEREQHLQLRSQLNQEMEKFAMLNNSLSKEVEDLRQQRQKLEKDWELLDDKSAVLDLECEKFKEEKKRLERWHHGEEQRLRQIEQEVSLKFELLRKEQERSTMLQLHEHQLEMSMQKKQEDQEKMLQEVENSVQAGLAFEEIQIESLKCTYETKLRRIEMENVQLKGEKELFMMDKQKLETDQIEIRKDIDRLSFLSSKLKIQQKEFVEEKGRFLALAEQCQSCKNCGSAVFKDSDLLGLQDDRSMQIPNLAFEAHLESHNAELSAKIEDSHVNSGGRISWLQKCSRFFNFSPTQKIESAECSSEFDQGENSPSFNEMLDREALEDEAHYAPTPSFTFANDSVSDYSGPPYAEAEKSEAPQELDKSGDIPIPSFKAMDKCVTVIPHEPLTAPSDHKELDESSVPPDEFSELPANESLLELSKRRQKQPNRRSRHNNFSRTHSVIAVMEDAKAVLGEAFEGGEDDVRAKHTLHAQEENHGESLPTGHIEANVRKKRPLVTLQGTAAGELDTEDGDGMSESAPLRGHRKRRHISGPVAQTPGRKSYNLRSKKTVGSAAASKTITGERRGRTMGRAVQKSPQNEMTKSSDSGERPSKTELVLDPSSSFVADRQETAKVLHKSDSGGAIGIHEISLENFSQIDEQAPHAPEQSSVEIVGKSGEFREGSTEYEILVDGTSTECDPSAADGEPEAEQYDEDDEADASNERRTSIGKMIWNFFTT